MSVIAAAGAAWLSCKLVPEGAYSRWPGSLIFMRLRFEADLYALETAAKSQLRIYQRAAAISSAQSTCEQAAIGHRSGWSGMAVVKVDVACRYVASAAQGEACCCCCFGYAAKSYT